MTAAAVDVFAEGKQIAHHQIRTSKDRAIQALKNESATSTTTFMGNQKSLIDVAGAETADSRDPFTRMEAVSNGFQGLGHRQSHGSQIETMPGLRREQDRSVQNHRRLQSALELCFDHIHQLEVRRHAGGISVFKRRCATHGAAGVVSDHSVHQKIHRPLHVKVLQSLP